MHVNKRGLYTRQDLEDAGLPDATYTAVKQAAEIMLVCELALDNANYDADDEETLFSVADTTQRLLAEARDLVGFTLEKLEE